MRIIYLIIIAITTLVLAACGGVASYDNEDTAGPGLIFEGGDTSIASGTPLGAAAGVAVASVAGLVELDPAEGADDGVDARLQNPQLFGELANADISIENNGVEVLGGEGVSVARGLLRRDQQEPEGFFFVGYLLFPNATLESVPERRAAARAFLCLLSRAERVIEEGGETQNIAVFLAPVNIAREEDVAAADWDVDFLLQAYDYTRAQMLATRFGLNRTGVYLVGYAPDSWDVSGVPGGVLQIDFAGWRATEVEAAVLALESAFRLETWFAGATNDDLDEASFLDVARRVFDSLGRMVITPAEAAQTEDAADIVVPTRCG